ncbi:hypothetical protein GCM10022409_48140 [Hymenobacter glaciei]|uniref:Uncharacterized protein n=1 Tax=Hymenobacter glaciei TaxID=877209 RepID=A0ABP7UYG0_9BACT
MPLDRCQRGDQTALTAQPVQGLKAFLASAAALLASISSFSGCEKENVGPNGS